MTENNQKPRFVEVVRYVRPVQDHWFPVSEFEEKSNLYGVTIFFTLDYERKKVQASWSVCNGENFNRIDGVDYAKNSDILVEFELSSIDTYSGLVPALILHLAIEVYGINVNQFKVLGEYPEQHELFKRALRHYRGKK